MPDTTPSANMGFGIPIVSQDPGPQWATDVNTALQTIDQHTHAPGYGLPIPSGGININSDLPFNNFNAYALKTVRFQPLGSPASSGTDVGCIYVSGQDLYYNDTIGRRVQLTALGSIVSASGNITNLAPPASVVYFPGSGTFVFQSSATVAANIDVASVIVRNATGGSNGVTIQAANTTPAFTFTLPNGMGTNRWGLRTDGGTKTQWFPENSNGSLLNASIALSVASSALTFSLFGSNGLVASSTNPIEICFRSATAATPTTNIRQATSGLAFPITCQTTLGIVSGSSGNLWPYAIDSDGAGALKLGAAGVLVDEHSLQNTVAESTPCTIASSTPAVMVAVGHNYQNNNRIRFTTTGTLANFLLPNFDYYVTNRMTDSFYASSSLGGAAVGVSNAGSGIHTIHAADASVIVSDAAYTAKPVKTLSRLKINPSATGVWNILPLEVCMDTAAFTEGIKLRYESRATPVMTKSTENIVPWDTIFYDSHNMGAYDANSASLGIISTFIVPRAGTYLVSATTIGSGGATWAAADDWALAVQQNSSQVYRFETVMQTANTIAPSAQISATIKCAALDTLRITCNPEKAAAGNVSLLANANFNWVSIVRIGD